MSKKKRGFYPGPEGHLASQPMLLLKLLRELMDDGDIKVVVEDPSDYNSIIAGYDELSYDDLTLLLLARSVKNKKEQSPTPTK